MGRFFPLKGSHSIKWTRNTCNFLGAWDNGLGDEGANIVYLKHLYVQIALAFLHSTHCATHTSSLVETMVVPTQSAKNLVVKKKNKAPSSEVCLP